MIILQKHIIKMSWLRITGIDVYQHQTRANFINLSDDRIICGGDFVKYSVVNLKWLGKLERYLFLFSYIIIS